ncbi:putative hemolysin-III channel protein Izh2 [Gigaspora margarita]|uniref:Putative hemolysin-III channel protein Izh2 n=1 Tax=Gigaspora margarita TaxID=4874 RepID=A0A8H4EN44_GIGMA|nr:putative hemolysin-III channel protein Izh2 [Gigaspora margarita]
MASHKKITNPERSLPESATTILIISNNINSSSNAKPEKNRNNHDNYLDGSSKVANEVAIYGSLCNFGDLPNWCQDNNDIVSGYRKPTFSYLKCAYSLFYIHNESRTIIFVCLTFITHFYVLSSQSTITWQDSFVLYMFLAGAMVCLGLSSVFHVLCCHSEKVCANWNRCDYIGIVFLITGSFYPVIYYGFFCNEYLKIFYLSFITILAIATTFLAVSPKFRHPQFRWFRTSLFLSMGLSAVIPLTHAVILYGIELCFFVISLKWLLLTGILYIIGALVYGARRAGRIVFRGETFLAVSPKFRHHNSDGFEHHYFLPMGLNAVIPLTHAVILYGAYILFRFKDILQFIKILCISIWSKVCTYIRTYVNTYNTRKMVSWKIHICGSSHHLFVVAAALVHYHGVVQSMIYWHKENYECTLDIESMKFK